MDTQKLEAALYELNDLALKEYHEPLARVADRPGDDEATRILRLGRLIGVEMKKPFASAKERDSPSPFSGAYRAWDLKPESAFDDPKNQNTWQYQTLEALHSDTAVIAAFGQESSVYVLAGSAVGERGFFGYLVVATRDYLCKKGDLRAEVEREVEAARKNGLDLKNVTPEGIVLAGGLGLGATLVQAIPILGFVGPPAIAGLVFIIYKIGLNAFCSWSAGREFCRPRYMSSETWDSRIRESVGVRVGVRAVNEPAATSLDPADFWLHYVDFWEPTRRLELLTCCLQNSCSAN